MSEVVQNLLSWEEGEAWLICSIQDDVSLNVNSQVVR